jgi:hypothetical protein
VDLQCGDVGAGLVDAGEHGGEQEGVMAADAATEGLLQQAPLGPQAGPGQLGQDLGVALTGTSAASMARPESRRCRWPPPRA